MSASFVFQKVTDFFENYANEFKMLKKALSAEDATKAFLIIYGCMKNILNEEDMKTIYSSLFYAEGFRIYSAQVLRAYNSLNQ